MNNTEENYIFLVYNVSCSFRENLAKLCAPWRVHAPLGANYALMHKLHHIQVFVRKCFFVLYYITVFCAQMSD